MEHLCVIFEYWCMDAESVMSAVFYLRLSREDTAQGISESIQSQHLLLSSYASSQHWRVQAVYADDGLSGTTAERPAFQAMMQAIAAGSVEIVLVKDLSRLSRDYLQTGELLEHFFPSHGVRFISVCDGIDTGKKLAANDYTPIRAVMDDFYARDISRKVRAAIAARQRSGKCTMARLPYGFERRDACIVQNVIQASVVQMIFQKYIEGVSMRQIALYLQREKIQPPKSAWSDTMIRHILCNYAYSGILMLHTTEKYSYKSRQKRYLSPQEWIPYSVSPIIPQELFDAVQKQLAFRGHHAASESWLSGRVFCAECGKLMIFSGSERLICSGRKRHSSCTNPSISSSILEEALMKQLHEDGADVFPKAISSLLERIDVGLESIQFTFRYQQP